MQDIQVCYDPVTRHVIGTASFKTKDPALQGKSSKFVKVSGTNPVTGNKCETVAFDDASKVPSDAGEGDRKYVYTEAGDIIRCPWITVEIPDHDPDALPLNTDIRVVVKYNSDSSFSFAELPTEIKFKDRSQFITVEPLLNLDQTTLQVETTIKSAFPGVSELRAKDKTFMCFFETLNVRFRQ